MEPGAVPPCPEVVLREIRGVRGRLPVSARGEHGGDRGAPERPEVDREHEETQARRQARHQLCEEPLCLIRLVLRLHVRHRLHRVHERRVARLGRPYVLVPGHSEVIPQLPHSQGLEDTVEHRARGV